MSTNNVKITSQMLSITARDLTASRLAVEGFNLPPSHAVQSWENSLVDLPVERAANNRSGGYAIIAS